MNIFSFQTLIAVLKSQENFLQRIFSTSGIFVREYTYAMPFYVLVQILV
jgi:hypothetical protein